MIWSLILLILAIIAFFWGLGVKSLLRNRPVDGFVSADRRFDVVFIALWPVVITVVYFYEKALKLLGREVEP